MYAQVVMFLLPQEVLLINLHLRLEVVHLRQNQKSVQREAHFWGIGGIIMRGTEMEGIFFMYSTIDINYDDLIQNASSVLAYLGRQGDSFTIISKMKPPYLQRPVNCMHSEALKPLEPFLIEQIPEVRQWAVTKTKEGHLVLSRYRLCRESRQELRKLPNLFDFSQRPPEDLCVYRKGQAKEWFASCTHERFAYMADPSEADLTFLEQLGVRFNRCGSTEI